MLKNFKCPLEIEELKELNHFLEGSFDVCDS